MPRRKKNEGGAAVAEPEVVVDVEQAVDTGEVVDLDEVPTEDVEPVDMSKVIVFIGPKPTDAVTMALESGDGLLELTNDELLLWCHNNIDGAETAPKRRRMKWLADHVPGISTARVAKILGVRYQQAYNLLNPEPKERPEGTVQCIRCGRPLVDENSIAQKIGPICAHKADEDTEGEEGEE